MKIICVDKCPASLKTLLHEARRIAPDAQVYGCKSPEEAIKTAKSEGCDVLVTDTDLNCLHLTGFALAEKIKEINPHVNIILVSDHASNVEATNAFRIRASGYVTRPFEPERLADEFRNLRYAPREPRA